MYIHEIKILWDHKRSTQRLQQKLSNSENKIPSKLFVYPISNVNDNVHISQTRSETHRDQHTF